MLQPLRPSSLVRPVAYPQPVATRAVEASPLPPVVPPEGPTRPTDRYGESLMGTAMHAVPASAVGAGIGFLVGGPVGAAWGAGIGAVAAHGFMYAVLGMADGGQVPAALVSAGAAALAGATLGLTVGAGGAALGLVAGPAIAVAGYLGLRSYLDRQIRA